ncbi:hypothetical protein Mal15_48620 [Stieleria maiorica]|uniref:Uncharacterized protein n=1 Tax=Stieleria maiorica TaxID=2795974 RepID=A0A5B9MK25_9BACT|nr:hypothetical protein [Stieleria maiorica]QEG00790.1 hypothetical protein Mal15_48620 [Stieleria maiorica]
MFHALIANTHSKSKPPNPAVTATPSFDPATTRTSFESEDRNDRLLSQEERRIVMWLLPLLILSISPPILLVVLHWFFPHVMLLDTVQGP